MNKKLQTVFHSKYFYLVVSVIVAISLWIIALNTSNPVIENTVEVAITFVNENSPAEKNLSRTSELGVIMSTIRVSGRQDTVNNLLASDIKVEVDLAEVKGTGITYLKVKKPKCDRIGVKIEDYFPKEIEVAYDTKSEMYLPVKTEYSNDLLKAGYEYISVVAEPDSIPISGFLSEIENLDYIKVSLSDNVAKGAIDSNKTISLLGRYITTGGQDVTANFSTEKVTVKIEVAKRVPIKYGVTGVPAIGYYRSDSNSEAGTVLLQSTSDVLADIESLDLGNIDITGAMGNVKSKINLNDYIPDGVTIYGDANREVTVNIAKYQEKELEIEIDDMTRPGLDGQKYLYTITFDESVLSTDGKAYVKVKGKAASIERLTIESLSPKLDLTDIIAVGSYSKVVTFVVPEDVEILGTYKVIVTVEELPEDLTTTTPDAESTESPTETVEPTATAIQNQGATPASEIQN